MSLFYSIHNSVNNKKPPKKAVSYFRLIFVSSFFSFAQIDYSKTNKLGQMGYQVYPDVALDRAEIENAVLMQNKEEETR